MKRNSLQKMKNKVWRGLDNGPFYDILKERKAWPKDEKDNPRNEQKLIDLL